MNVLTDPRAAFDSRFLVLVFFESSRLSCAFLDTNLLLAASSKFCCSDLLARLVTECWLSHAGRFFAMKLSDILDWYILNSERFKV